MTLSKATILSLMDQQGLRPSRALGQNFVADPNTVRRIARLAEVGNADRVLEIGPGLGSLTLALAETGAAVTAVEIDRFIFPVLQGVLREAGVLDERPEHGPGISGRVKVIQADAMSAPWDDILRPSQGWVLVANLPYNVATPLVADLLDTVPAIDRMLVMVQREVAERLAAGPGDVGYGAVSVKVAYWAQARIAGNVSASVFVPQPRVGSALVDIRRRERPAVDPELVAPSHLFELVRAGFAHRRKMLRGALAGMVSPEDLQSVGIDPQARAEQLSVHDWGRLAAYVRRTAA